MRKILGFLIALFSLGVNAQGFPNKPVKIVVGFSAGGPTDVIARLRDGHAPA